MCHALTLLTLSFVWHGVCLKRSLMIGQTSLTAGSTERATLAGRGLRMNRARLPQVLILHQDHEVRSTLRRTLQRVGYQIVDCENADQFVRLIDPGPGERTAVSTSELAICEAQLLRGHSLDVVVRRQNDRTFPPLIIMVNRQNESRRLPPRLRTAAVFDKPFATDDQLATVRKLLPHQRKVDD